MNVCVNYAGHYDQIAMVDEIGCLAHVIPLSDPLDPSIRNVYSRRPNAIIQHNSLTSDHEIGHVKR